jgi:glycosyltransferase involved in cell wall biosynthesis
VKVAVVFQDMPPQAGGGFSFQRAILDALTETADSTNHEFVYYAAGDPANVSDPHITVIPNTRPAILKRRIQETVRDAQDYRLSRRVVQAPSWLNKSCEANGVDLVWFASSHAEDVDLPFIFTVWDVEYIRQPWWPEVSRGGIWELRDHFYNRYVTKATRVIVPNAAGTQQLTTYFRIEPDRILELPHPVPAIQASAGPSDDDAAAVRELGVSRPFIFYPAQFWAHKNHLTLLNALAELDDLDAVLVGSDKGNLPAVEAEVARLGLAGRVHFPGFIPEQTMVALYRETEALVYPSWFGPENMPPLEAFALGCPVVAADVPGAREQMGDAALLVPPLDHHGFAEAIKRARDRNMREKLIEAGRDQLDGRRPEDYVARVVAFLDEFEVLRRSWV